MIIVDEISHMDYNFVQQKIFPLMSQGNTVSLGMTTKKERGDWFSEYVHEPAVRTKTEYIDFTSVCNACSLLPPAQMAQCRHKPGGDVMWRDDAMMKALQASMTQGAILTEYMGADPISTSAFDYEQVSRFLDNNNVSDLLPSANSIVTAGVFIDPNGGGSCHSAIVIAILMKNADLVIYNIDDRQTGPFEEYYSLVADNVNAFLDRFNKNDNMILWMFVESQATWMAEQTMDLFKGRDNIICFKDNANKQRAGIIVTNRLKRDYADALKQRMSINAIKFHRNAFTCNPGMSMTDMKRSAKRQLVAMQWDHNKLTGKSNGQNDDIAIVIMMAAYWLPKVLEKGDTIFKEQNKQLAQAKERLLQKREANYRMTRK